MWRRVGYLPGELRLESRVTGMALLSHYAEISGGVASTSLSRQVCTLSRGNRQKVGQTFFLSSPVLSEIRQAADSVAFLRGERAVSVSSVEELRRTAVRLRDHGGGRDSRSRLGRQRDW